MIERHGYDLEQQLQLARQEIVDLKAEFLRLPIGKRGGKGGPEKEIIVLGEACVKLLE